MELAKGRKSTFGWPKDTINDLLQTVEEIRKQKKRWQRLEKISNMVGLGTMSED
jgi:hypothetical protein